MNRPHSSYISSSETIPERTQYKAAWTRFWSPSFDRILLMCVRMVTSERKSWLAISWSVFPFVRSCRTSVSRAERSFLPRDATAFPGLSTCSIFQAIVGLRRSVGNKRDGLNELFRLRIFYHAGFSGSRSISASPPGRAGSHVLAAQLGKEGRPQPQPGTAAFKKGLGGEQNRNRSVPPDQPPGGPNLMALAITAWM